MKTIKILFLAADPRGSTSLKLDEEIRKITHKVRLSNYRDNVNIVSAWAVRPDDLLQCLNQHQPQIVHFSGHGTSTGEIILVDDNLNSKPVSTTALKALFNTLKDNIQVVLLNSCYSQIQAKVINEVIDYVIGMNAAVGDEAAIVFAASFYRALGFNRTVQEAFDQAKTALLLEGIPDQDVPVLLVRQGVSSARKILVEESEPWLELKQTDIGICRPMWGFRQKTSSHILFGCNLSFYNRTPRTIQFQVSRLLFGQRELECGDRILVRASDSGYYIPNLYPVAGVGLNIEIDYRVENYSN